MASERSRHAAGLSGRATAAAMESDRAKHAAAERARYHGVKADETGLADNSPEADVERAKCLRDPVYFYDTIIAGETVNRRTRERTTQRLGKIHKLMLDFAHFTELGPDFESNFGLRKWLSDPDEAGIYPERWLYFSSLHRPPEMQIGADGPISQMFHTSKTPWQGVVIRVCGAGLTKCVLIPREHLKSTVLTEVDTLHSILRNPSIRVLLASQTGTMAKLFMGSIQRNFESNPRFKRLWGNLGPPAKRECEWNTEMMTVRRPFTTDKEPTLWSVGLSGNSTGGHFNRIIGDDLVGNKNNTDVGKKAACTFAESLEPLRAEPDGELLYVGTVWAEDDPHSLYVSPDNEMYQDTSFMVASVLDADQKPLWDENLTRESVDRKMRAIRDESFRFGQYWNQLRGTSAKPFDPSWIGQYEGKPEAAAVKQKLDIFIAVDTASGKKKQAGKLDPTGALVLGQVPDRERYYVLDGFNEKLTAAEIAVACVDLYLKWKGIAAEYGGQVRFGAEETAYTTYLEPILRYEMKARGVESSFTVTPLKHDNDSKYQRIVTLVQPYSEGKVLWPETLKRPCAKRFNLPGNKAPIGAPYDLRAQLQDGFTRYPAVAHEELLDCNAYCYEMASPRKLYKTNARPVLVSQPTGKGVYRRDGQVAADKEENAMGGFDRPGRWVMGVPE
jgi:hypothetical protein